MKKFSFSKIKATVFGKLCVLIYEGEKISTNGGEI